MNLINNIHLTNTYFYYKVMWKLVKDGEKRK